MASKRISRFASSFTVASAAVLLWTVGCGKTEQIRTYTVPKEAKVAPVADTPVAKPGELTDRMLAAILPNGSQAWFFKTVGPVAEIDKHEKEITDFFTGLSLAADGRAKWKLPDGWKEEAGNGIRLATIVIPGGKRLEITVSTANWSDPPKSMLDNVNRWRGQLQLSPIGPVQLSEVSRESKAGDHPITIVDMRGQFKSGGMTPPFAGGGFGPRATGSPGKNANPPGALPEGHPPIDTSNDPPAGLPAGHPPIDSPSPQTNAPSKNSAASDLLPKFDLPPAWKPVPAGGMRLAEFAVGEGQQAPHMAVSRFPADAGPMIADPLANINRWRGELGLAPIQKDAISGATQTIQVDGTPALYAPMVPGAAKKDESQAKEATLAAIVKSGNQIWFFKMRGERELVKKHEDEFKAFLKSLKFSHDKEAGNGNK